MGRFAWECFAIPKRDWMSCPCFCEVCNRLRVGKKQKKIYLCNAVCADVPLKPEYICPLENKGTQWLCKGKTYQCCLSPSHVRNLVTLCSSYQPPELPFYEKMKTDIVHWMFVFFVLIVNLLFLCWYCKNKYLLFSDQMKAM